jgi:hypothetical protein
VNALAIADGEAAGDGTVLATAGALAAGEATGFAAGAVVGGGPAVGAAGGAWGVHAAMKLASGADTLAATSVRTKWRRLRPRALSHATRLEIGSSDISLL